MLGEDVGMPAFPAARAPGDSGSILEGTTAALGTGEYLSVFPGVLGVWQGGLQREKGAGDDLLESKC